MCTSKQRIQLAIASCLLLLAQLSVPAATNTWLGNMFFTNAANWSGGVPAAGDEVVITDSTTSTNLMLTDNRTIGGLSLGSAGTRTAAFYISNVTAGITLTMTNGMIANGLGGTLGTIEFFRVPVVIANDQTFTIGGGTASTTADAGIRFRERANGVQNAITLNGTLYKNGPGMLSFVGNNVGNGNVVVNQGVLKLNGGGSTTITVGGTGAITVNSGAGLYISRNSGAYNLTKAIVMNDGSTLRIGGGTTSDNIGSPFTFNGAVTVAAEYSSSATVPTITFTNTWSGPGVLTINNNQSAVSNIWVLRESVSGLTGRINNQGNMERIRFGSNCVGSASAEWALNNGNAAFETFGARDVQLGALSGGSGTLRSSDPAALAVKFTVGALNTSTTYGGVIIDGSSVVSLVKVGTGRLTLTGNSTFTGGTTVSNGSLFLSGASAVLSSPVAVQPGAVLGGNGTMYGAVSVANTGKVQADVGGTALTMNSLTLGLGGGDFTTNALNVALGGKVTTGSLTLNGACRIDILGAALPVGVYDLITYGGGSIGGSGFAGFSLGRLPYGISANLQDSGSAVQLNITANTLETRIWVGNAASQWSLGPELDWKGAVSGVAQTFHDEDVVQFDDSATSFNVNVTALVQPSGITVNNTAHNYTWSGIGTVSGTAALVKNGTGSLVLGNTNTFTGGTTLNAGVLQIGDGGTAGSLAGPLTNLAAVVLNRADAGAFTGGITGTGTVEKQGAGSFALGGANSYSGAAMVAAGTLVAGSGTALGDTNGFTTVVNGATLDVNGQNLNGEYLTVSGGGVAGAGAIVNNGAGDQQNALRFVTLSGPTTFGGFRRWDVRDPAVSAATAGVNAWLLGNGNTLTKVGSNIVAFINIGDTALGNIDIQGGTLTFSRSTSPGDPTKPVTLWAGANLQFHRLSEYMDNPFNKNIYMTNAAITIESNGLTNTVAGAVGLTGSNTFNIPTTATGLKMQSTVSGNSSLTVLGPGSLWFNANATYTGGTTLNGAVLVVNGTLGPSGVPMSLLGACTLAGNGTIRDAVTIPGGSTLSPGEGDIGSLTINNALVLGAGSTTRIEYSKDIGNTNDNVRGLTSVVLGGTLVMTNTGYTTPVPGDSFKLFYASSYSGMFSSIVPSVPGAGLVWYTNDLPVNGTLKVMVLPNPQPPIVYSVSSLFSNSLNVIFNMEVEQSSAMDPNNYTISTGQTVAYGQVLNLTNVLLTLNSPLTTRNFSVQVKNVRNTSYIPDTVVTTNLPGVAWGFISPPVDVNVGAATNGSAFAYWTNTIKVYATGADIFGTADAFSFVWREMAGDFDVSVDLNYLLETDAAAKAGLMARDMTDATYPAMQEREITIASFPGQGIGRNQNLFQYREEFGTNTLAPAAPRPASTFPDNWLRLKRKGSVFWGMVSSNNWDWVAVNAVDTATNSAGAYPPTLRVGLAVTSHNVALTTESFWSSYGLPNERPTLNMAWSTNAPGVLDFSWPSWIVGSYKLQVTPSLSPPAIWSDVSGSQTTNFLSLAVGPGNLFFRLSP